MSNGISIKSQFKMAAKEICKPNTPVEHSQVEQAKNVEPDSKTSKSYAQVALSVEQRGVRRKDGGLKPEAAKPFRLGVRMTRQEQDIVVRRAKEARLTISEYVRASVLGAGYVSAFDPVKRQLLRDIGRELGKQGGNLNQIAKQLNQKFITADQGETMLGHLARSLLSAHEAVRQALTAGKEME